MRSISRTSLPLAVFLLLLSPLCAAAGKPTLESILSAPFPSEILASPSGGRLAWIQNERGVRNLWVASPPDYRGRPVTRYDKDDGQDLGDVEWTPDGKTLFYVRGGSGNRQGESPNPTSDPAGAEQAIWRISVDGGDPVRLGPGSAPAVSPRGDGVAFARKGQILWAGLYGPDGPDKKTEPAALVQTRGGSSTLRWSPDGSKLAFVSNRGDHSFVGVYDMAGKTVRWLAPGVDSDAQPAWSPDGTRVAFLRVPARKVYPLFRPNRETQPWSILVADAATGRAATVWSAREGFGSAFHEIEAANQIVWGAGDRLVFPWEGDGWLHLYSVSASGGEVTLLTPGDFEVESVVPTPDRRELIVVSNQGDIDRRHLWRVPVAGGSPVAVTRGEENEWMPAVIPDGKALAYIRSGPRRPAQAMIRMGSGEARELAPGTVPADFPESELVVPEPVIYSAADGLRIHAQLFRPRDLKPGERRPALIFLHGGSFRQMILGWHYNSYYNKAYGMNQYLASRGYVVLAINYRAGIGYGLKFREAENAGAAGAAEFNDVLGAGLYLRNRPDVDPDRIGLWGGSYGGYLTALGLARASYLFAAGVDFHGVHNWNVGIRNFIPDYAPTPEEERLAFQSSPMASLETWRSPVLLIHGDDDRNVAFSETVDLAEELRKRKVDVEVMVLPDEVHGFLRHASWVAAYHAAADFFDRKLRNGH
jgi:dipeptidyl aminopeptidase/acylaminoacyl peptidase